MFEARHTSQASLGHGTGGGTPELVRLVREHTALRVADEADLEPVIYTSLGRGRDGREAPPPPRL